MSENINIVLGELEESLKTLRAAEEQVEQVLHSNQELSVALADLMVNTESLVSEIRTVTEGAVLQFSEKLTTSNDAVDKATTFCLSKIEGNIKEFERANNSYREAAEAKIVEVSDTAKQTITEQRAESLRVLNDILETNNSIKKLVSELLNLQLSSTIETINNKLAQIQKKNNSQFKTLKILGAVGLAVLILDAALLLVKLFI
jgi:hypothetical protein